MSSRHGAVELEFGDGEYTFRLGLAEIEELEAKQNAGVFQIATRLAPETRACRSSDIVQVIRLGLIGGGMKPVDALAKVRKYVDERPIDESRDVAYAVALAGLKRVHSSELEEAPPGEAAAAETSVSTSPPSMPAQP
ncbi:MAG: gene transfer agent family protein [Aurantimonas endophytica]|uniref:gene transfer agent family protein n=1 Tax=Aurantimonas endophytica TaxID=1522175 RepID=UPI0030029391